MRRLRPQRKTNLFPADAPDFRQRRMCYGKRAYTEKQARSVLGRMKKSVPDPELLNAYPCPECGWFHIGNNQRLMEQ